MASKSAASIMMASETVTRSINLLVELQKKPNAGELLDKLGLTFVDVNRMINVLDEYDKVLDHVLKTSHIEWPPNLDEFLWS